MIVLNVLNSKRNHWELLRSYSVKHTNAFETADVLSDENTAKQAAYTTTKMLKPYDTRRKKRQHDRLHAWRKLS